MLCGAQGNHFCVLVALGTPVYVCWDSYGHLQRVRTTTHDCKSSNTPSATLKFTIWWPKLQHSLASQFHWSQVLGFISSIIRYHTKVTTFYGYNVLWGLGVTQDLHFLTTSAEQQNRLWCVWTIQPDGNVVVVRHHRLGVASAWNNWIWGCLPWDVHSIKQPGLVQHPCDYDSLLHVVVQSPRHRSTYIGILQTGFRANDIGNSTQRTQHWIQPCDKLHSVSKELLPAESHIV